MIRECPYVAEIRVGAYIYRAARWGENLLDSLRAIVHLCVRSGGSGGD